MKPNLFTEAVHQLVNYWFKKEGDILSGHSYYKGNW